MKEKLHHLSACEIRDAFLKGDLKAVQIAEFFLSRMKTHDPKLGAFLSSLEVRALLKAEALDKKRSHNQPL